MELSTRSIVIGDEERSSLQKNVWSENYVRAHMVIQGNKEPILLRYRGGHTRDYPKKSYEVVRNGKTYHYNAEFDDPSMIRNALSFQFFQWIGVPSPRTQHCLLKLNGQSLGVYLEIEGVDRTFFRRRNISVKSLFYAVNDNADLTLFNPETQRRKTSLFNGYEHILGTESERQQWKSFIMNLNTLKGAKLGRYLKERVDIDNYLRWLAGAVCTGNFDGFDQNYAVYRHKKTMKYRMIPWDYEGTWGRNCYGKKCGSDLVRVEGYNQLTKKLLSYRAIRSRYKVLLHSIVNQHLTIKKIDPVVHRMYGSIAPHIYEDSMRKWSFSVFDGEPELIRSYIKERRKIILDSLKKL